MEPSQHISNGVYNYVWQMFILPPPLKAEVGMYVSTFASTEKSSLEQELLAVGFIEFNEQRRIYVTTQKLVDYVQILKI